MILRTAGKLGTWTWPFGTDHWELTQEMEWAGMKLSKKMAEKWPLPADLEQDLEPAGSL